MESNIERVRVGFRNIDELENLGQIMDSMNALDELQFELLKQKEKLQGIVVDMADGETLEKAKKKMGVKPACCCR